MTSSIRSYESISDYKFNNLKSTLQGRVYEIIHCWYFFFFFDKLVTCGYVYPFPFSTFSCPSNIPSRILILKTSSSSFSIFFYLLCSVSWTLAISWTMTYCKQLRSLTARYSCCIVPMLAIILMNSAQSWIFWGIVSAFFLFYVVLHYP